MLPQGRVGCKDTDPSVICHALSHAPDDGLGRELQRVAQDVLKRLVAPVAAEGREAVQQLVHQDAERPPVHAWAVASRIDDLAPASGVWSMGQTKVIVDMLIKCKR